MDIINILEVLIGVAATGILGIISFLTTRRIKIMQLKKNIKNELSRILSTLAKQDDKNIVFLNTSIWDAMVSSALLLELVTNKSYKNIIGIYSNIKYLNILDSANSRNIDIISKRRKEISDAIKELGIKEANHEGTK